ncbi:MAG: KdsC family phosphatase [Muribaculaceae bacterium]
MSKFNYPIEKIRGIAFDVDGVLSPTVVPLGDDGIPRRMANLKDGYAIVQAVKQGLHIAIITGAVAPGLAERFAMCGVTDFYCGRLDKLDVLREWMAKYDLQPEEVAFVGDDVPDVAPMRYVGLGVAPRDASRDALAAADYVAEACGGHGVGRELIEEIMRAQGTWQCTDKAFG